MSKKKDVVNGQHRLPTYKRLESKLDNEFFSFKQIFELKRDNKIFVDEAFLSLERWSVEDKKEFIQSAITGNAVSLLCYGDVGALVQSSEDFSSKDHYKSIHDEGYVYIVIDSNNRSITIYEFLGSEFPLPRGKYELVGGSTLILEEDTNFCDLESKFQDVIGGMTLESKIVTKADRSQLSGAFIKVNSGVTQNAQEMRNAYLHKIAEMIRNDAKDLKPKFIELELFKELDCNRRKIDEFYLDMVIYELSNKEGRVVWNKTWRNNYYVDNSPLETYIKKTKKLLQSILNLKDISFESLRELRTVYTVLSKLESNKELKIRDYTKAVKRILELHRAFMQDTTLKIQIDKGKEFTYRAASRMVWGQVCWIVENIIDGIYQDKDGVLDIIQEVDTKRFFSQQQKYQLWVTQGGDIRKNKHSVCPQTKKQISLSDAFSDKFHADHIIPYSKGGLTNLENAQLVCSHYNKQKSNKLFDNNLTTPIT